MAVIRLTSPKLDTDTAAVLRRISDIEVKLKNGVFKPSPESRESDFAANASPVKQSEPNEAQTQQVKKRKSPKAKRLFPIKHLPLMPSQTMRSRK